MINSIILFALFSCCHDFTNSVFSHHEFPSSMKVTGDVSNIFNPNLTQSLLPLHTMKNDINCTEINHLFIIGITVPGTEGKVPSLFLQHPRTYCPN